MVCWIYFHFCYTGVNKQKHLLTKHFSGQPIHLPSLFQTWDGLSLLRIFPWLTTGAKLQSKLRMMSFNLQHLPQGRFFFFFNIYLILAALGLRCCARAFPCSGTQFSHCCGFSCCWAWVLGHRYSRCGHWLCCSGGMCKLSRSGMVPVSPALAGGLLASRPTKIPHRQGLQHMH